MTDDTQPSTLNEDQLKEIADKGYLNVAIYFRVRLDDGRIFTQRSSKVPVFSQEDYDCKVKEAYEPKGIGETVALAQRFYRSAQERLKDLVVGEQVTNLDIWEESSE